MQDTKRNKEAFPDKILPNKQNIIIDMRFVERKQKSEYLLEMIEKGRCISYQQVSEKFNCSESIVKRMISELKEEGNNVKYCKIVGKFIIEIG